MPTTTERTYRIAVEGRVVLRPDIAGFPDVGPDVARYFADHFARFCLADADVACPDLYDWTHERVVSVEEVMDGAHVIEHVRGYGQSAPAPDHEKRIHELEMGFARQASAIRELEERRAVEEMVAAVGLPAPLVEPPAEAAGCGDCQRAWSGTGGSLPGCRTHAPELWAEAGMNAALDALHAVGA